MTERVSQIQRWCEKETSCCKFLCDMNSFCCHASEGEKHHHLGLHIMKTLSGIWSRNLNVSATGMSLDLIYILAESSPESAGFSLPPPEGPSSWSVSSSGNSQNAPLAELHQLHSNSRDKKSGTNTLWSSLGGEDTAWRTGMFSADVPSKHPTVTAHFSLWSVAALAFIQPCSLNTVHWWNVIQTEVLSSVQIPALSVVTQGHCNSVLQLFTLFVICEKKL